MGRPTQRILIYIIIIIINIILIICRTLLLPGVDSARLAMLDLRARGAVVLNHNPLRPSGYRLRQQ